MKLRSLFLKAFLTLTLLGLLSSIGIAAWVYFKLIPNLPDTAELQNVRLQVPLRVYSRDGALLAEFGEQRRLPLNYDQIPPRQVQAFLSAEDDRFFEHPGVDYQGLLRAAYQLALTGKKTQGGSTITMQVARNFFLSRKKSYLRKINEILLALKIERELNKESILELYVNKIYLGHRSYGIGAAAQVYYGKDISELSLAQMAMIAGLPKAPSAFNPISNPPRAKIRRNYVLGRMLKLGYINQKEHDDAKAAPVVARYHGPKVDLDAGYVAEMVRAEMVKRYGAERTYNEGFKVVTSVDSQLQATAQTSLQKALLDYDQRHGYRGAEHQFKTLPDSDADLDDLLRPYLVLGGLKPAIVLSLDEQTAEIYLAGGAHLTLDWDAMKWARPYISENRQGKKPTKAEDILAVGDLIRIQSIESPPKEEGDPSEINFRLAQVPAAQGALVSISPDNGRINAIMGGFDFNHNKFNRAIQAQRQAGSGFKPFVYSAALEKGLTVATTINDAPVVFNDPSLEGSWRPENYSGKVFGPTRLRVGLYKSRNLVSIRLLRKIGVEYTASYLENIGFDPNRIPHNLSLALGSATITPLEMAAAQSVWANGGFRIKPWLIERIEDAKGEVLYQADPVTVCEECPQPAENKDAVAADSTPNAQPTALVPSDADTTDNAPDTSKVARRVVEKRNAYLVYSMMQDVVQRGTARRAKALGRKDLAGKTGTTNEQRDAWFSGYNAKVVTIAWVGFDEFEPLGRGEVGGRAALPAWMSYMKVALDGMPESPRPEPSGLVRVRIDPETGRRASPSNAKAVFELFRKEYAPKYERGVIQRPKIIKKPPSSSSSDTPNSPEGSATGQGIQAGEEDDSLF